MENPKKTQHLLVVDDDSRIRSLLQKYLVENNYFVSIVKNTTEAISLLKEIECDLIILDVMIPGETGIEFAKRLRLGKYSNIPILMLTAMGEVDDRIAGLEVGADDYLVKPFEPRELLLRITKILKRSQESRSFYYFGDFIYDLPRQLLLQKDKKIFLTQSEYSLLNSLLKNSNKIVSREELAEELGINERSVDVQIIRLRSKIENNPSRPLFLQTVRGKGYIIRL
ncbi:MAG: response regulator [Rickettsiales bacterium]|jgi:two-component system phosphate regulon response regulator OmpR|nr:response regulator [Rickettsiales bacterium]